MRVKMNTSHDLGSMTEAGAMTVPPLTGTTVTRVSSQLRVPMRVHVLPNRKMRSCQEHCWSTVVTVKYPSIYIPNIYIYIYLYTDD